MFSHIHEPMAFAGGRVATRVRDVTTDPAALDGRGFWVVAVTFEGEITCVRFEEVGPIASVKPAPWRGPAPHEWTTSMTREAYLRAVCAIRARIAAGDFYQVNLCRVLSAPMPAARTGAPGDILALAAAVARGNPAPHAAALRLPGRGIHIAGASPELFLRRRGRCVESAPIKGTASRAADLLDKDRAENVMIVDLVRNDLGRVCATGSVTVPALCDVVAHPGLVHMVSTVRGELAPSVGWPELLSAAFPPGSVSGAPKPAALQAIAVYENTPRGPYCGALGWVDADAGIGDLAVGIRTFWLAGDRLHFGTGAGITWGSDPSAEWSETELKAARLLSLAAGTRRSR